LDGKGRITVPSRWRDLLMTNVQGQMVVAKNPDRLPVAVPAAGVGAVRGHLLACRPNTKAGAACSWAAPPTSRSTAHRACSSRPSCGSGRGLEKDVKFMGVGPNFELWDMARYEAREAVTIAQGMPEALRNLVLR
jgi:MraZ protein